MPFAKFAFIREKTRDENDNQKARIWATLCHFSSLAWLLPLALLGFLGIPFLYLVSVTSFLGPLVIWRLKKNQHPFINTQGKEALNFQISLTLYTLLLALVFFLGAFSISIFPILESSGNERIKAILTVANVALMPMALVVPIIGIINVVSVIIAMLQVTKGQSYRYPYNFRWIK